MDGVSAVRPGGRFRRGGQGVANGAARLDRNLARVAAAKGDPAEAAKRQAEYLKTSPPGLAPLVEYAKYLRDAGEDSAATLLVWIMVMAGALLLLAVSTVWVGMKITLVSRVPDADAPS